MRCLSRRGSLRLIMYSSTCFSYKEYIVAFDLRVFHYFYQLLIISFVHLFVIYESFFCLRLSGS